ncbi:hypothetical protein PINS_up004035 [Pythium insidiosum]|nr:hypothetical protein PINS_up004035 [Pythium insidiosum]
MRKLYVELFFVIIVLLYGVFVLIQIAVDEATLADYKKIIDVTDITFGSMLLIEIVLNVFAYGLEYLKNGWSLFDAIVIVISFALSILAASGSSSRWLINILRLRVVLRILRVLVVFERLKQRSQTMKLAHRHPITSPVEQVLRLLNELRYHPALKSSTRNDIDYAIDVIKNNRLYNVEVVAGGDVDDDTQQWLRGEILKVNDDDMVLTDDANENGNDRNGPGANTGRPSNTGIGAGSTLTAFKRGTTMKELLPALDPASEVELQSVLATINTWTFDVFRVNALTGGHPLVQIGYHLLHDLAGMVLQIEMTTLVSFLTEIQSGYVATNPYHNAIHAADVMQTTHYFLVQPELVPFLRPLDRALALIAAGIHDFKHDGFNNSFHISTASEIALRYNDHAVLENFHVAQSFLVMKNPEHNILGRLSPEDFKYGREMIIQMVLATDMARHFEDVALFKANILPAPGEELAIKSLADKKLLLKMILHTSDVSNPAKERETMLRWTERVVEEFFLQGDMEKQLSLAVSPFMDRDTIVLKKMQVGFADFIVAPLFSVWAQIITEVDQVAYKTLLQNREFWFGLTEEFKPHNIKDAVREWTTKKRLSQSSIVSAEAEVPNTSRVRRSIASMLGSTDDA